MSAVDVEDIRASHIGETIQLRGTVSSISANMIGISSAFYCCSKCGCSYTVQNEVPYGKPTKPLKCSVEAGCGATKSNLELIENQSTFVDFRIIHLIPYSGAMGAEPVELVVTNMETSIEHGTGVISEAQIRSKEIKGHLVIPYGFADDIELIPMRSGVESQISDSNASLVRKICNNICAEGDGKAPLNHIYREAANANVSECVVDEVLSQMRMTGELFSPTNDVYSFAR